MLAIFQGPPITSFVIRALLLSDLSTIKGELKLFHKRISRLSNLPRNAVDAVAACDKVIYPNVFRLLQLLATHPVSSASNERSFSHLKHIKSYLRNSIGEARLNAWTGHVEHSLRHRRANCDRQPNC